MKRTEEYPKSRDCFSTSTQPPLISSSRSARTLWHQQGIRGLGLAAVKADARSQGWCIDADRRRRGNLVDGQNGAVNDREGAVRVPRGGRSVDVARRREAGTPEADAITAGKKAVARNV